MDRRLLLLGGTVVGDVRRSGDGEALLIRVIRIRRVGADLGGVDRERAGDRVYDVVLRLVGASCVGDLCSAAERAIVAASVRALGGIREATQRLAIKQARGRIAGDLVLLAIIGNGLALARDRGRHGGCRDGQGAIGDLDRDLLVVRAGSRELVRGQAHGVGAHVRALCNSALAVVQADADGAVDRSGIGGPAFDGLLGAVIGERAGLARHVDSSFVGLVHGQCALSRRDVVVCSLRVLVERVGEGIGHRAGIGDGASHVIRRTLALDEAVTADSDVAVRERRSIIGLGVACGGQGHVAFLDLVGARDGAGEVALAGNGHRDGAGVHGRGVGDVVVGSVNRRSALLEGDGDGLLLLLAVVFGVLGPAHREGVLIRDVACRNFKLADALGDRVVALLCRLVEGERVGVIRLASLGLAAGGREGRGLVVDEAGDGALGGQRRAVVGLRSIRCLDRQRGLVDLVGAVERARVVALASNGDVNGTHVGGVAVVAQVVVGAFGQRCTGLGVLDRDALLLLLAVVGDIRRIRDLEAGLVVDVGSRDGEGARHEGHAVVALAGLSRRGDSVRARLLALGAAQRVADRVVVQRAGNSSREGRIVLAVLLGSVVGRHRDSLLGHADVQAILLDSLVAGLGGADADVARGAHVGTARCIRRPRRSAISRVLDRCARDGSRGAEGMGLAVVGSVDGVGVDQADLCAVDDRDGLAIGSGADIELVVVQRLIGAGPVGACCLGDNCLDLGLVDARCCVDSDDSRSGACIGCGAICVVQLDIHRNVGFAVLGPLAHEVEVAVRCIGDVAAVDGEGVAWLIDLAGRVALEHPAREVLALLCGCALRDDEGAIVLVGARGSCIVVARRIGRRGIRRRDDGDADILRPPAPTIGTDGDGVGAVAVLFQRPVAAGIRQQVSIFVTSGDGYARRAQRVAILDRERECRVITGVPDTEVEDSRIELVAIHMVGRAAVGRHVVDADELVDPDLGGVLVLVVRAHRDVAVDVLARGSRDGDVVARCRRAAAPRDRDGRAIGERRGGGAIGRRNVGHDFARSQRDGQLVQHLRVRGPLVVPIQLEADGAAGGVAEAAAGCGIQRRSAVGQIGVGGVCKRQRMLAREVHGHGRGAGDAAQGVAIAGRRDGAAIRDDAVDRKARGRREGDVRGTIGGHTGRTDKRAGIGCRGLLAVDRVLVGNGVGTTVVDLEIRGLGCSDLRDGAVSGHSKECSVRSDGERDDIGVVDGCMVKCVASRNSAGRSCIHGDVARFKGPGRRGAVVVVHERDRRRCRCSRLADAEQRIDRESGDERRAGLSRIRAGALLDACRFFALGGLLCGRGFILRGFFGRSGLVRAGCRLGSRSIVRRSAVRCARIIRCCRSSLLAFKHVDGRSSRRLSRSGASRDRTFVHRRCRL